MRLTDPCSRSKQEGEMEDNTDHEEAADSFLTPGLSSHEAALREDESEEEEEQETSDVENDDVKQARSAAQKTLHAKPPPTLDVTVHRLRHLNYHPKPVLCLASTPCDGGLVALSRDSGAVELKRARKLRTVATIAGYRQKTVNSMVWLPFADEGTSASVPATSPASSSSPESVVLAPLIGASRDGTVFCVDFARLRLTDITPSGGGAVFALATKVRRGLVPHAGSPPRSSSLASNSSRPGDRFLFAAGCQDGSTRIWKYGPSDADANEPSGSKRIAVVSTLPSAGAPILSLAWSPNADGTASRSTIYAAAADGTIRVYDEDPASPLRWSASLRITVESMGRATPTRVWALEVLSDGTLVSADSLGHVQFWEGRTGTLQQTIDQNDSKADVLCLAVSEDESVVFASGVDSRVICIERVPITTKRMQVDSYVTVRHWSLSYAQRPHTHDVNALAIVRQALRKNLAPSEKRTEEFQEILCSAGVDTKLCTYLVHEGTKKRPKTLYPWPSNLVSLARGRRVFIVMREASIDVFQLGPKCSKEASFPIQIPPERTALGTVKIDGDSNLLCAAISDDGRYLALSDASSVSIFRLEFENNGDMILGMLQPIKVTIESDATFAATAMHFQGSQHDLICGCHDGKLRILRIVSRPEKSSVAQVVQAFHSLGFGDVTSAAVQSIVCTADGGFLATMQTVPTTRLEIYRAACSSSEPEGTSYRHWWTVPDLEMSPCVISFLLTEQPQLAVACLNFTAYVFNVHERKLSPWSEAAGYPIRNLPPEFFHRNDYPVHVALNPASPNKFLMVRLLTRPTSSFCFGCDLLARTLFQHLGSIASGVLGCHPCQIKLVH
jgi:U3 small nucleolar RNA-associated protein 4